MKRYSRTGVAGGRVRKNAVFKRFLILKNRGLISFRHASPLIDSSPDCGAAHRASGHVRLSTGAAMTARSGTDRFLCPPQTPFGVRPLVEVRLRDPHRLCSPEAQRTLVTQGIWCDHRLKRIRFRPLEVHLASEISELNDVLEDLKQQKTATPVTIRQFLGWFGAQRRTSANVDYVNKQLAQAGIRTVPNYLNIWVDTPITFELVSQHAETDGDGKTGGRMDGDQDTISNPDSVSSGDPSYRVGKISSANNLPVSVKPNASLLEAITLMHFKNYSQLPVMTTDREVKGVISWESIGARSATSITGLDVQSYMDDHHELPATASLFAAIKTIVEHNYVLIRGLDRKITGIVTATDIALQFEEISTPFLLLAEIENSIRIMISSKLTLADIKRSCSPEHLPANFSNVSDLTFGNYVKALENVENWQKIGLKLDRVTFCAELNDINSIRNDVMHFDPDPLTKRDLSVLKNASKLLDSLRGMGAF